MDTQRLILFFVFVFSTFMLVDAWQREQRPQAPQTQSAAKGAGQLNGKADGNVTPAPGAIPVPQAPATTAADLEAAESDQRLPARSEGGVELTRRRNGEGGGGAPQRERLQGW